MLFPPENRGQRKYLPTPLTHEQRNVSVIFKPFVLRTTVVRRVFSLFFLFFYYLKTRECIKVSARTCTPPSPQNRFSCAFICRRVRL